MTSTAKTAYLDNRDTVGKEDVVGAHSDGSNVKGRVERLNSGGHGDDRGGGGGHGVFSYIGVPFPGTHCDSNISPGYSPTPSTPHYELFYPAFAPTIHPNMKFRYLISILSPFICSSSVIHPKF